MNKFLVVMMFAVGCATTGSAVPTTKRADWSGFFIYEATSDRHTVAYLVKQQPELPILRKGNFDALVSSTWVPCALEGAGAKDRCFDVPGSGDQIVVKNDGQVLVRHKLWPTCYALYRAKKFDGHELDTGTVDGPLYRFAAEEEYFLKPEGIGCLKVLDSLGTP